ncbi:MAG: transposase [Bacteroidales bacterium]|nr:transposase [Bacteroidales bacterium]
MLRNKDIKNLNELEQSFVDNHKKADFFANIMEILKIGKHHAIFSSVKQKGIPVVELIKILIYLPFIEQNSIYAFTKSYWDRVAGFGKDAYYRMKNNPLINWRVFLTAIVIRVLNTEKHLSTNIKSGKITAFIFDDTTLAKTGYLIEGVSKVWDHVIQKHILGFKLLVMGLYNGSMFLPVNFSLHREKGKNKKHPFGLKPKHYKKQFRKKRDNKTRGYERKKELDTDKIKSTIKMLKYAIKKGIMAKYVLTDSWFSCWELIDVSIKNSMHFIGMYSKVRTKFKYNNKYFNYKEIRRINRKNIKRSRRFGLYYIRTIVELNGQKVVLYSTRRGKRGNWKTIISTDLSLNFNQTIEVYQIHWTIEVFFKESKQLLNLGKSQSNDFDGQIADITINMIQYIFLAVRNKIDKYESLGTLFRNTKADILERTLHERLIALLIAIVKKIVTVFEQLDEEEIIEKLINDATTFEMFRSILILPNPVKIAS